jgi:hypothetical protein
VPLDAIELGDRGHGVTVELASADGLAADLCAWTRDHVERAAVHVGAPSAL